MSSLPSTSDPAIDRILDFWFDDRFPITRWFFASDALDQEINTSFGPLISQARTKDLDHWTSEPKGTLALIVLLDQFSRNVYRGTPDSYNADAKAVDVTTKAMAKGFDRKVSLIQQSFFILPLVHSESLIGQIAAKALYEGLATRCAAEEGGKKALDFAHASLDAAQKHMDVIARFGRFPARNKAIGRESTEEEKAFLERNPKGL